MVVERLKGALTALITPFDAAGEVDLVALERIVQKQLAQGIDGLVPCGTTGETPTLEVSEQERVVRTVVDLADRRVPVIAGTGSNSTRIAIEQTRRAKAWGVDAALVVCPYYNKPTQEGMFQHFKAIWEATGMPLVVYNVPSRTVTDLLPETIGRLAEAGIIVGIKDATADMARCAETRTAVGDRSVAFLSGDDFTILPYMATGGVGVISVVSNLCPADTSRLVMESAAGNFAVARPLNQRLVALTRVLFSSSSPIPLKAGMAAAGWCENRLRLPLCSGDAALTSRVMDAMNRYRGEAVTASLAGWMS